MLTESCRQLFPLCYCQEIIQSTDFELQIREEEDDLRDEPVLIGMWAKEPRAQRGRQETGVWELERAKRDKGSEQCSSMGSTIILICGLK